MTLRAYVEGPTDVLVAVRVAQHAGLNLLKENVFPLGGYGALDRDLPKLRASASSQKPVWVLRDCDPTAPNFKGERFARCASTVLKKLQVPNAGAGWCFRLARHEAESWLLADAAGISAWLGVPVSSVPKNPDGILKAKLAVVALARLSTKAHLRSGLVPRDGSTAEFGPRFEETLQQFVAGPWAPSRAAARSKSLRRCLRALRALKA